MFKVFNFKPSPVWQSVSRVVARWSIGGLSASVLPFRVASERSGVFNGIGVKEPEGMGCLEVEPEAVPYGTVA